MNTIKLAQLDYRNILISSYKELGLNENEVMVLLLIDSLKGENRSLITGDQLAIKMSLKGSEIDSILVELMNKGFLSYEQDGDMLITSMEKTYEKIINHFVKGVSSKLDDEEQKIQEDALGEVLAILQEQLQRSLTPLEIENVSSWFNDGVEKEMIISCINECFMTSKKPSVKKIDQLIIKNLSHQDREQEGFSTIDEKTKRDIKKAMDDVAYDWVNDDK